MGGIFLLKEETSNRKQRRITLNLDVTIAVLFLACLMLRLPFVSSDFVRYTISDIIHPSSCSYFCISLINYQISWAINGALPFKSAAGKLAGTHHKLFRYCFREVCHANKKKITTKEAKRI